MSAIVAWLTEIDWVVFREWVLFVIQAGGLVALLLYVWATFKSNELSRAAMKKAEEARLKESMPQVALFFDLDPQSPNLVYLVLKNFGRRPAHSITVSSSPPLLDYGDPEHEFFSEGVKFLAPGQALRPFFGSAIELREHSSVPQDYNVQVDYDDGLTGERYYCKQPISLRDFKSITWVERSPAHPLEDIAKDLKGIRQILQSLEGMLKDRPKRP